MSLAGFTIALSGKLTLTRDEAIAKIEAEGGTYASSVTKAVTHVVVADPSATSQKIQKAKKSGKEVVGEDFLDGEGNGGQGSGGSSGAAKRARTEDAEDNEGGDVNSFAGKVFAISGALSMKRAQVINAIENGGGQYSSSVTKRVTHLIVSDPSATSAKIQKAKADGKVIVGEDFLKSGAAPAKKRRTGVSFEEAVKGLFSDSSSAGLSDTDFDAQVVALDEACKVGVPESLAKFYKLHDGAILNRTLIEIPSRPAKYAETSCINAFSELVESEDTCEEWEIPTGKYLLFSGDGHEWFALDYSVNKVDPPVVAIQQENEWEPTVLADTFLEFLANLVKDDGEHVDDILFTCG